MLGGSTLDVFKMTGLTFQGSGSWGFMFWQIRSRMAWGFGSPSGFRFQGFGFIGFRVIGFQV